MILQRRSAVIWTVIVMVIPFSAFVHADDGMYNVQGSLLHTMMFDSFFNENTNLIKTRLGEGDVLEDCSLYGGFYLACLVDAYEAMGDEAFRADASRVFKGLLGNLEITGIPGHLARGRTADGEWRGDPSVDQYTGVIYGFWRYYRSGMAGDEEKEAIRRTMVDMLRRMEKHDWRITKKNGDMSTFGRLHEPMATRADRLLSFLLAGYDITGDTHWLEVYREKVPSLLAHCYGYEDYESWVLIQSQVSMRMLYDLEQNPDIRDVYAHALNEMAALCRPQVEHFRELPPPDAGESVLAPYYDESPVFTKTIRIPIEAVTVMLLSADESWRREGRTCLDMLNKHLKAERLTMNVAVVPFEWNQWLVLKRTNNK